VEIIFGSSTKELLLEPQFGQEGAYTAYLIPTEAGDYTWRIFGTIEGEPVDVSMTSSPETFGSVEPKANSAFPRPEPALQDLDAEAGRAGQTAMIALVVGLVGLVLGIAGLVTGLMGLRAARRGTV
jgi:hypothetical protein